MTNQVTASFGLGTSRDVTSCDASPDKPPTIRSSDVCFSNSRLRIPVLASSRFVRQACALRGAIGFGTYRMAGGGGVHAHPSLRFGVSQAPLFEACDRVGDVLRRRDRCDQPLASLSPPSPGCRWTTLHAFAWVLPDEGRQDRFVRCCVNRGGFPDRGCLPSMRCHFASAKLTPRLGVSAHRAASRILACPHARRFHQRGPGSESEVGAPTHRSRITRRLFHPRLRLRRRFLAGEEASTPWTRSPFTPRPPRGRPGL